MPSSTLGALPAIDCRNGSASSSIALAMGGRIVDATIVAAPKQRNTDADKDAIRGGQVPEDWKERPAKAKPSVDGANRIDLAIPAFGYKNQISSDRRHGLIRNWTVSSAAAHDGARLEAALDRRNLASAVWADRYPAQ